MIVAASDEGTRAILRERLLAAGLACDEEVASPSMLQASLEGSEAAETTLVVLAAEDDSGLATLALAHGVPVLAWPAWGPGLLGARGPGARLPWVRPAQRDVRPRAGGQLTAREREVLALVAAGTSNKGIARTLRISPNTVKYHLTALFAKLGVATRAEAIAAAARAGELSL